MAKDNCKMLLSLFVVIWSALAPALAQGSGSERQCGHPAVPANARVTLSAGGGAVGASGAGVAPGSVATYECDDGYELFGAKTRDCTLRGNWTADPPFCGTNVAFRKPANQSTTVRGGGAANGNDGERTTEHDGKRCTETQREASPWWQVDLLRHYAVKVVRVTTRGCCGHQPLQDLEIRVGNSSSDLQRNPLCAWFPGTIDEGVTKTFTCARPLVGQHVFLQLVGVEGSLSLCEVEVFTTEEFSNDRCAPAGAGADIELAAFSRSCYEFNVNRGGSFDDARKQCQAHGGDLIHDFQGATLSFLTQELERRKAQLKTQLVWIGAQKEPGLTSRTWRWVNGELVGRPAWGKDQPNNYNGEQNCVVLDGGRSWLWNDVGCNLDYLHWICQYPITTWPKHQNLFYLVSSSGIAFDVKAHGNAAVGLAKKPGKKVDYWVGIGDNNRCWIKKDDQHCKTVPMKKHLSSEYYSRFWLQWNAGAIRLGRHGESKPIVSYITKLPTLKYITFSVMTLNVIWFRNQNPVHWRFDLPPVRPNTKLYKPVPGGKLTWVRAEDQLPDEAMIGGFEKEVLYIIRSPHRGSLTPGKFKPSEGVGYISWGGSCHSKAELEVLCGFDCTWVPTCDDKIPAGAFVGGFSEDRQERLYVGRAEHNGHIIPGKVQPSHKVCYISYDEREIGKSKYEILVEPIVVRSANNIYMSNVNVDSTSDSDPEEDNTWQADDDDDENDEDDDDASGGYHQVMEEVMAL